MTAKRRLHPNARNVCLPRRSNGLRPFLLLVFVLASSEALHASSYSDNFNGGAVNGAIWLNTSGQVRGEGELGFYDGHALWMGEQVTRYAETKDINTLHGGTISFAMRTGDDLHFHWEESDPEGPRGEGILLEYSVDSGASWNEFCYYRGWEPAFKVWSVFQYAIPAPARAVRARFRFRQIRHSGAIYDHWAIDNFTLTTVESGTSWSQPLPEGVQILKGRVGPSGAFHCVISSTVDFLLGDLTGTSGRYLARASAEGDWISLTSIQSMAPRDMLIDGSGNVYLCGSCGSDAFVAKYGNDHALQWFKIGHNLTIYQAGYDGLAVDAAGNVTVAGSFHNFMRFGPEGNIGEPEIRSDEPYCSLIARYDSAGNYQWSQQVGGDRTTTGPDEIHGITGDGSGGYYVFGRYGTQLSVDGLPYDLGTVPEWYYTPTLGFIVKYEDAGTSLTPLWMTNLDFSGQIRDVVCAASGLYAAGIFEQLHFRPNGIDFGIPRYDGGVHVCCLNSLDGSIYWVNVCTSHGWDTPCDGECLRVDDFENIYLAHTFNGEVSIYEASLGFPSLVAAVSPDPEFNLLLTRWMPLGTLQWTKRAGSGNIQTMDVNPVGQIFMAGECSDLAAFESEAVLGNPTAHYLHRFESSFVDTAPVGAYLLRQYIPSNTTVGEELGRFVTKDSDSMGAYYYELVTGAGDTHNSYFNVGSGPINSRKLFLSADAFLVEGDPLTCRVRVTDELNREAESILPFTVVAPDDGLWANSYSNMYIAFCEVGPNNETYIGGSFSSSNLTFGGATVACAGGSDVFVGKLDADGTPQWMMRGGGEGTDRAFALDVDADGNVYITGVLTGEFDFEIDNHWHWTALGGAPGGGFLDLFAMSLEPDGSLRWAFYCGGEDEESPRDIKYDPVNGVAYVTGYCRADAAFSGEAHSYAGFYDGEVDGPIHVPAVPYNSSADAFVLGYDPANGDLWVTFAVGEDTIEGKAVTVDSHGQVYAAGEFREQSDFAGTVRYVDEEWTDDMYLWKLDTSGDTAWVQTGGTSANSEDVLDVGVDASDRITVAARCWGYPSIGADEAEFGSVVLPLMYGPNPLFVSYDTNGIALSGHSFDNGEFETPLTGFEVFSNGAVMISGEFDYMDGAALARHADVLLVSPDGALLWSDFSTADWDCMGAGPDLCPKVAGDYVDSVEIAGQVLEDGTYFAAKVAGPGGFYAPPTSIVMDPPIGVAAMTSTAFTLSSGPDATIAENEPAGTVVASLSAVDPDSSVFTYQLYGGDGDDGNALFEVDGSDLVTCAPLNYEETSEYSIRLRAIDETGRTYEQVFVIGVLDVYDPITATVTLDDLIHVFDGNPHVATASTTPGGLPLDITYDGDTNEPVAAGPYTVAATVEHPEYSGSKIDELWIRTAIQDWLSAYYSDYYLNNADNETSVWGDLADPDGDRVPNMCENYHGSDPSASDAGKSCPVPEISDDGQSYVIFWERSKTRIVENALPHWALGLEENEWYDSGEGPPDDARSFSIEVVGETYSKETVSGSLPKGDEPTIFMRLLYPR